MPRCRKTPDELRQIREAVLRAVESAPAPPNFGELELALAWHRPMISRHYARLALAELEERKAIARRIVCRDRIGHRVIVYLPAGRFADAARK